MAVQCLFITVGGGAAAVTTAIAFFVVVAIEEANRVQQSEAVVDVVIVFLVVVRFQKGRVFGSVGVVVPPHHRSLARLLHFRQGQEDRAGFALNGLAATVAAGAWWAVLGSCLLVGWLSRKLVQPLTPRCCCIRFLRTPLPVTVDGCRYPPPIHPRRRKGPKRRGLMDKVSLIH